MSKELEGGSQASGYIRALMAKKKLNPKVKDHKKIPNTGKRVKFNISKKPRKYKNRLISENIIKRYGNKELSKEFGESYGYQRERSGKWEFWQMKDIPVKTLKKIMRGEELTDQEIEDLQEEDEEDVEHKPTLTEDRNLTEAKLEEDYPEYLTEAIKALLYYSRWQYNPSIDFLGGEVEESEEEEDF